MSRALLITASYDKQIRFWDVSSGRTVRYFIFQDSQVNCMLHIPSVNCLAIGGFGILRIYNLSQHAGHSKKDSDVQSPPPYSSYESQASMNFTSLAYFAVSYVAHAPPSTSQSVLQQNSLNAYPKTSSPNDLKLDAPALQETHERDVIVLCTTSEDGHIRFFDIRSHTSPRVLADISTGVAITCSGISPDRRYLLTGNQMGLLSVWHLSSIMAGAFAESTTSSPAAAGFGEAMKHLATRPLQNIVFNNNYAAIRSIAIEPLARWAAVANNTGHVHFIRLARSREASPTSIKELDKIFSDASKSLTSIATDEPDEIKGASADMQEGVSDLSDVKSSRTDNEKVSHGGEVALSIAASIAERQEKKTGASPNELHDDAFSSEATVDAGRGEDGAEGVGAGDATQTDLSERTYASHRVAEGKYVVLGDIQRALLFEVFHSHHAHCKYILKVLVSPQGDLVVTCSADYTIGRYIVPQQLRVAHINSSCDLPSPVVVNLLSIMRGGLDAGFSLNSNMPIPRGTISCNAHKKSVSNVVKSGDKIADGGAVSVNTLHARAEMSTLNQTEAKSVGDVTTRASDGALLQPESRDRSDSFVRNPAHASLSRNNATLAVSKNADEASSRELSLAASGTTETDAALPERGSTNFHALSPLQGHNRWVWDCVFSNCGNYLFSCSSDNSVRMWYNLKSERPQSMCFVGHTKSVISTVMYYE